MAILLEWLRLVQLQTFSISFVIVRTGVVHIVIMTLEVNAFI